MAPSQILTNLNSSWWVTTYPQGKNGIQCPATTVYYLDKANHYVSFNSSGAVDVLNTVTTTYITYLMEETANQLANGGCIGGITATRPSSYNPQPIYFA